MIKLIDKFSAVFANEAFLKASVAATLILYGVNLIAKLLCSLYSLFIVDSIFFLCVWALYVAYRRHNKNVQKGHLGLAALVLMIAAYESRFNAYKIKREAGTDIA